MVKDAEKDPEQQQTEREVLGRKVAKAVEKLPAQELNTREEIQEWLEDDTNW